MASLKIRLDIDPVTNAMKRLGIGLATKAITRSLNRSIRGVNTDASRAVRKELTLKLKDVKGNLHVMKARPRELEAALLIVVRGIGLIKFQARDTKRGVTVRVKRRGGRKRVKGAFIGRAKTSGSMQVFRRQRGAGRTPIDKLFSTAPGQYLNEERVLGPIGRAAQVRFTKELTAQVTHLLR